MKKSKLLILSLLLAAAMISCDKDMKDKDNSGMMMLNGGVVLLEKVGSLPVSVGEVMPYIIPGANNGGNRTCAEVATEFDKDFDLCGDKIDYSGSSFIGEFPEGLEVTVTGGKFVAFEMDGCIEIEGKFYKVGAVIVKGSNEANVYFYPGGILSDAGLAPPVNASGAPAGLSNITFCFIECESIVAFKAFLLEGTNGIISISSGNLVGYDDADGAWCDNLGYHTYMPSSFDIIDPDGSPVYGTATILANGDITISLNSGLVLDKLYLYIGTLENLQSDLNPYCPDYENEENWEFFDTNGNSVTITPTP